MQFKIAAIALIRDGDRILIGKKVPWRGPYPDTWNLPGGGMDLGRETTEEALKREVLEETGLEVKSLRKVAWDTDVAKDKEGVERYYIFLQFLCETAGGELRPGDDMDHLEWVDLKDIPGYHLNEPTRRLLEKLGLI